jgi:hypothetical protein
MSGFSRFARSSRVPLANGSAKEQYRRRVQKRVAKEQAGTVPSVEQIADPEILIEVCHQLKRQAGQAPGPDGVTYADLSPSEVASCMRGLSKILLNGLYRPSPGRLVQIPKASGKGHRTLTLRNVLDRVVAAALNEALAPFWERVFLPGSMGFRPRRGPWDMLIELERRVLGENRYVLAIDDIKDAFDHVNLGELMNDHRRHIQDEKLLDLVEIVLRGGGNRDRKEGIEQGNAYSSTALNVRLHHAHDLGLGQDPTNTSWLRYADNLVYLTRDVPEGLEALQRSQELLQPSGFTLKGEDGPPVDLREGQAHLLGFVLSFKDRQMAYGLDEDAWRGLEQSLERAHELPNPPSHAEQAVMGWIGAYGPAFEGTRREASERVLSVTACHGFREVLGSPEKVWQEWQRSWSHWQGRRKSLCE